MELDYLTGLWSQQASSNIAMQRSIWCILKHCWLTAVLISIHTAVTNMR